MTNTLIYIWTVIALLGISSVSALIWAVASGQLGQFQKGATTTFDNYSELAGDWCAEFEKSIPSWLETNRMIQRRRLMLMTGGLFVAFVATDSLPAQEASFAELSDRLTV